MRKKLLSMMLVVGMANVMVGCASTVDLTETQSDLVASYLSNVIVRYDKNENNNKLLKLEESVEETATPAPVETIAPAATAKPEEQSASTAGTNKDTTDEKAEKIDQMSKITLESLYGLNNVSITYKNVKEYKTYPNSSSADAITAKEGKKFIAVTFTMKNKTNKDIDVNMMKKEVDFSLKANDKTWVSSVYTLLDNDMTYYQGSLKAKKSKDLVVIFEAKDSLKLSKATFYAMDTKKKAYEVDIK